MARAVEVAAELHHLAQRDPVSSSKLEGHNSSFYEMPISRVSHNVGLASLPGSVLALVLRHLPREAQLWLRQSCQELCSHVSTVLGDARMSRAIGFERRLRIPAAFCGVPDLLALLHRLCNRFGIGGNTWTLRVDIRVQRDADGTVHFSCGRMAARKALAAVASAPAVFDVQITTSGTRAACHQCVLC
jgi:hypothetical protein